MPKTTKPRKPASSNYEDAPRGRTKRDKIIRAVSMLLVFGLVATFLIGALAGSPAGATERVAGTGAAGGEPDLGRADAGETEEDTCAAAAAGILPADSVPGWKLAAGTAKAGAEEEEEV